MKKKKILLYDLETTGVDPQTCTPRVMGFLSSEMEGFRWTTSIDHMVHVFNSHDIIVGFNSVDFDNVILKRYGADTFYKINVDIMKIIHGSGYGNDKGRIGIITTKEGKHLADVLHSKTLADTTKALGGPLKIGDFDYNLFKKPFVDLTKEQQKECLEYLEADIRATEYLYEYLEEYFADFKDGGITIGGEFRPFMTPEQRAKKFYLRSSTASWTYKVLCNLAGLEERYSNNPPESYGGGFVALPTQESCAGDIYCLDYNSLYPHIMMMANLYSKNGDWRGSGLSETTGSYDSQNLAPVGKVLRELYQKRLEYKKNKDEKQYTIKIIINTIYGLLGNPSFASVSDFTAAADCTALGRQWVQAARKHFSDYGYNVLYTDTDSVYLEDVYGDKERLLKCKDEHIRDIKDSVPFPQDTFDMGIDDEIRFMAFFKSKHTDEFLKKNYLYVTKAGKLKVKGMQIIKSNCTKLSKTIFAKYIKPAILDRNEYKFNRSQIEEWIYDELSADIKLASVFYKIKEVSEYKLRSQIQAQISSTYGPGQYNLLKLKREHPKAAGINKNYLDVKHAEEINIGQLDLSKSWAELEPFIKSAQSTLTNFW